MLINLNRLSNSNPPLYFDLMLVPKTKDYPGSLRIKIGNNENEFTGVLNVNFVTAKKFAKFLETIANPAPSLIGTSREINLPKMMSKNPHKSKMAMKILAVIGVNIRLGFAVDFLTMSVITPKRDIQKFADAINLLLEQS